MSIWGSIKRFFKGEGKKVATKAVDKIADKAHKKLDPPKRKATEPGKTRGPK